MKNILRLEEAAMFLLSILVFSHMHYAWWVFPAWILAPDISMIGYLINNKVGALCYNLAHHKAIAIAVLVLGFFTHNAWLKLAGIILFGHSSMDRMLGYGLKYPDSFHNTHLGWIGKKE